MPNARSEASPPPCLPPWYVAGCRCQAAPLDDTKISVHRAVDEEEGRIVSTSITVLSPWWLSPRRHPYGPEPTLVRAGPVRCFRYRRRPERHLYLSSRHGDQNIGSSKQFEPHN
ncbi:hypothetical protein PHJA_002751600 [Phtheirospermum japonicum]|uniref:Uncharacterized protein n=1 Tax=Phtheirospermum japonicum TaxID=374723 RepID=A0A830DH21_9LAMI|nr:hypothetical protein PHJA_002751600 [Phtheirospermum japonicum]